MERIQKLILESQHKQALEEISRVSGDSSSDPQWFVERGRAYAGMGEFKLAAEEFKRASDAYEKLDGEKKRAAKVQVVSNAPASADLPLKESDVPTVVDESPSLPKPKFDWYQDNSFVYISITAKKVQKNELTVKLSTTSIDVGVFNKHRLNLTTFALLDPAKSSHSVTEYKIELKLAKSVPGNWPQLETMAMKSTATPIPISATTAAVLPTPYASGKSTKDWSKIEKEIDDGKEEEGDPLNGLLKKIYKDADEDTRRAMMKSYQTSGGTVLTTNWKEAEEKDFAKTIKPPKGQVYKNWNGDVIAADDDDKDD